jgi:hypothetical protein
MEFTPEETAKLVETLSNSVYSMESESSKETTLELARKILDKAKSEGLDIRPYDEETYMGRTYRIRPKKGLGQWHDGWTAGDPGYETIDYTEFDRRLTAERDSMDEGKLKVLEGCKHIRLEDRGIAVYVDRELSGRIYFYRFMFSSQGFAIEGPFEDYDLSVKAKTDSKRFKDWAVQDIFDVFKNFADGMPATLETADLIRAVRDREIDKLRPLVEEIRREREMQKLRDAYYERNQMP